MPASTNHFRKVSREISMCRAAPAEPPPQVSVRSHGSSAGRVPGPAHEHLRSTCCLPAGLGSCGSGIRRHHHGISPSVAAPVSSSRPASPPPTPSCDCQPAPRSRPQPVVTPACSSVANPSAASNPQLRMGQRHFGFAELRHYRFALTSRVGARLKCLCGRRIEMSV